MLERLNDLPPGIDGIKATGTITKDDYEQVVIPLLDDVRRAGTRLRLLFEAGPEFKGYTAGAAWEDAKMGLRSFHLFDACAVVTDVAWIREMMRLTEFLLPCPVMAFSNQDRTLALQWLAVFPEGPAVTQRLLTDAGVIVVEVTQALRTQDFDALALTADRWIEAHGALNGIVIHMRAFPGWGNVGSLIRHVKFVRDHHRKVRRVALSADSKLASLAPRLAEHFVAAEIRTFGYDDRDAAIAWAAGGR